MSIIHIEWDGPFTLEEVKKLNNEIDYGVYQIYGADPTYRRISLLYIGLAGRTPNATFAVTVPHERHECYGVTGDDNRICVYVGRLQGPTPENDDWTNEIELAECLLVWAHYPPYNTQKKGALSRPEIPTLRVLNWGNYRDLLPEISGVRLGKKPEMKSYGCVS